MSAMDEVNRQHLAMAGVDPDTLGKPQERPEEPDRCGALRLLDGVVEVRCARPAGHEGRHVRGTVSWDERIPEKRPYDRVQCAAEKRGDGGYVYRCLREHGHDLNHMNGDESWPNTFKQREGDQPLPVPNEHPDIQSAVIADIEKRRELGIQRYGTALQPLNGRDMLVDAYDEAIDLAIYLKGAIVERDLRAAGELQTREVDGQ